MELKTIQSTVTRNYPEDEELQVEFYTDVPISVTESLQDDNMSEVTRTGLFLESVIADWNFAGRDGEKLPIKKDVIGSLGQRLVIWLVKEASDIVKVDELKKKE